MTKSNEMRQLMKSFLLFAFGNFLLFSAYNFTLALQSSINVEGGLGTTAVSCIYFSSIFFGLTTTPFLLQQIGPKRCMMLSQMSMMIFIACNYYPTLYTMIPGAVLAGFTEATIWPCTTMMNIYFGLEYWKKKNNSAKTQGYYVASLTGYYFTIHHFSQIFGSLVGFLVLNVFGNEQQEEAFVNSTSNATMTSLPYDVTIDSTRHLASCGSNDCQDAQNIEKSIENYKPTSRVKLIVLVSIYVLMCFVTIIVHSFVLPNITTKSLVTFFESKEKANDIGDGIDFLDDDSKSANDERTTDENAHLKTTGQTEDKLEIREPSHCLPSLFHTLKQVVNQLTKPMQLLILPITLYEGLLMGIIFAELPRAYVSCVNGVATLSLYTCLYGIGHVLSSFIVSRFSHKIGRLYIMAVVAALDAGNFLFMLLWKPNLDTSWTVYVSFFAFGLSDGIWQPCINVFYVEFFPENRGVAASVWISTASLGLAIQFAWSTALCVSAKLYVMMATLGVGYTLLCVASRIHQKKLKEVSNNNR